MSKIISLLLFVCVAGVGISHNARAQTTGQVVGAVGGAIAGALIGKATGMHRDGQILTGAIGAGVGVWAGSPSAPQVVYVAPPQGGYASGGQVATNTCTQQEVDNATGKVVRYLPVGCTPPGQTTTQVAVAPIQQQIIAAPVYQGDACSRYNGSHLEFSCREAARAAYDIEMGRFAQQAAAVGRAAAMRGY